MDTLQQLRMEVEEILTSIHTAKTDEQLVAIWNAHPLMTTRVWHGHPLERIVVTLRKMLDSKHYYIKHLQPQEQPEIKVVSCTPTQNTGYTILSWGKNGVVKSSTEITRYDTSE